MSTQLYILKTKFIDSNQKPVPAVINYKKNKISCTNNFYPYIFLKLYLVSPAANDISERSASSMCQSKTDWEVQCHSPERLNHCMLLSIHEDSIRLI